MNDEIRREHPPMESPNPGAQGATPMGGGPSGCGSEHGIREGACADGNDPCDPRPDRATRYIETTLGVLSYSELAPHLAERVARVEAALIAEEFASRPLDENLVLEIHARICGDLTPEWAGRWRNVL